MQTVLHSEPLAAAAALARLGLTEDVLAMATMQGYLARTNCTANHPPMYAPFVAWGETVRHLREGLAPDGWTRSNDRNSARTIHPEGHIALTVATGNESTGRDLPGESPSTRSAKGPCMADALEVNRSQAWLPGMEPEAFELAEADADKDQPTTWILLIHHAKDEIRSELSLPLDMDETGRVTVWRERILLRPMPLDPVSVEVTAPVLPDIDVAVRRKA